MNSKLRETLETLYGNIDQGVLQTEVYLDQAEKAIRQAVGEEMLGIVGDDEDDDGFWDDESVSKERALGLLPVVARNELRAELRQKIKEWQEETTK